MLKSVRIEKTSLGFYLKEQEQLLAEIVTEGVIPDDENLKDVKMQLLQQHKESYAHRRIHSAFMRGTEEVRDDNNSWLWMKKGYLKKETEGLTIAAQDQSLRTKWVKHYIDRTTDSLKCRMCGTMDENVSHLVSEYYELAQNECKKLRHDKVTDCYTGGDARIMDSRRMRNMNTSLKRKSEY